jgi:hypothetical protein
MLLNWFRFSKLLRDWLKVLKMNFIGMSRVVFRKWVFLSRLKVWVLTSRSLISICRGLLSSRWKRVVRRFSVVPRQLLT